LTLFSICLFVCSAGSAARAAAVTADTHVLAPDMAGQQVPILVSGGEAVSGIDFFVQVGDGGTTVGGDDTGPRITQVDLTIGTIFAGNNTGVFLDPAPLIWGATTTTQSGSVSASGVLATLTIDTTGMFDGQFDLILNPASTGPTAFADPGITTSLIHGSLSIGDLPVSGDYNQDGTVDAADYVVWRKTVGSQEGYNTWRTNFGRTATSGSLAIRAVPEPEALVILVSALLTVLPHRRSKPSDTARRCNFEGVQLPKMYLMLAFKELHDEDCLGTGFADPPAIFRRASHCTAGSVNRTADVR
jgi:hypothetical protein